MDMRPAVGLQTLPVNMLLYYQIKYRQTTNHVQQSTDNQSLLITGLMFIYPQIEERDELLSNQFGEDM